MGWWSGAVLYQVYPRSFMDSDGDGVGDLSGVIARLDHVADLGVDGLWLSPVFRSPMCDFGYDVADFCDIDPVFGDLGDFDRLVSEAHARGLKVVLDQVWSHTSDRHPWFAQSLADPNGPRGDWYVWADARPDGTPPNNWQSVFGGPAWTWSPRRRQYYLHNFLAEQPDLNFHNPAVREAILDTARFWLERGVDGFRLDVVNYYTHDRSLRDNPPSGLRDLPTPYRYQRHLHDCSQPETLTFLGDLRRLLDTYGALGLGEVFDDAPLARQREYTDSADRLHTAYSFHLLEATSADPSLFEQAIAAWQGAVGLPAWSLGNHDVARFPSRLHAEDPARAKQLLALLLCLPGLPILYQGDELALPQARVPFDRLQDPFAIAAYDGEPGRDGARTPFPWTAGGVQAGFSEALQTWLPLDDAHRTLAVDQQAGDPDSVLNFVRGFIAQRKTLPALRTGAATLVSAPTGVLAFERQAPGQRLLCLFELSGKPVQMAVDPGGVLLGAKLSGALFDGRADLPPYGAALIAYSSPMAGERAGQPRVEGAGGSPMPGAPSDAKTKPPAQPAPTTKRTRDLGRQDADSPSAIPLNPPRGDGS